MNRKRIVIIIILAGFFLRGYNSQCQIIDKQSILNRFTFWDNKDWDWYKNKIPFFDCPETDINATYYYRWELITKHLVYGSPKSGYNFTEFLNFPGWSGRYGAISCPVGHQLDEIRWLKDRRIINDYSNYWFETSGAQPRSYSNWYATSLWDIYKVWQDTDFVRMVYPHMQEQYQGWVKEHYDANHKMFEWDGMHDGMESNINGRQTKNWFAGGIGYRPTLNSYMYGDLNALSNAAELLGDEEKAKFYKEESQSIKKQVQQQLWDPKRQFFFHQWSEDRAGSILKPNTLHEWSAETKDSIIKKYSLTYQTGPYAGNLHGRELIGYVPWQFNLPDSGYSVAWKFLMNKNYFESEYGPTSTEQEDPLFYVAPQCCKWSGQSWPYATAQTLVAMANLLNNYKQDYVNKDDYIKLLRTFTRTQRFNGRPYIAESADPFTGSWDGSNKFYHSEHYFHSQYVNLIITGLAGLRPRADDTLEINPLIPNHWDYFALDGVEYHGHLVSLVWDREGNHYGKGKGLMIFDNGQKIDSSATIRRLLVPIDPAPKYSKPDRMINFAVNNDNKYYPHLYASSSNPKNPSFYAQDGNYWYNKVPANRWTSEGDGRKQEWVMLDFGIERPLSRLELYFLDDGSGLVKAPLKYDAQFWNGWNWITIPGQQRKFATPIGHRPNSISFKEIKTSKVRIIIQPKENAAVGLTEIEAWGNASLPLASPTEKVPDLAYNAKLSASFNSEQLNEITDLNYALPGRTGGQWSAAKSPNKSDWIQVDFGKQKQVSGLDIYLVGSQTENAEPFTIKYWDKGQWLLVKRKSTIPKMPMSMALNKVLMDPVKTSKIRIYFDHSLLASMDVTELMVWETDRLTE